MKEITIPVDQLDGIVARYFKPGERVVMYLSVPRELTSQELAKYQESLETNGARLLAPVEMGEYGDSPHVIKLEIATPSYSGVGNIPLVVMLVLALGAVGIIAYGGITITNVIKENIIPITIIGGITLLGVLLIMSKKPTSTSFAAGPVSGKYQTN